VLLCAASVLFISPRFRLTEGSGAVVHVDRYPRAARSARYGFSALLGGDVETYVVQGKAEDGSCRFVRADHHDQHAQHDKKAAGELDLTVARTKDPASTVATYIVRCRSEKTALRGIGNEAYVCDLASGTGIVGRVRDAAFLLLLDAKTPDGASLRAHLADAAEQVAGNLF
jgi:hypothetical protein